ncbi:hypothetical protein D3P07_00615 [Paenibacillus sp. 1011MAR3C5]|uniref:hypothetical protein n=1 Tax=Paenibacillus sp. 1011MAR3C5 TaxID=1675787 RepID=UPI000E6BFC2E|nr:hypothetical protein [Paenibacillus sp. 1011MAR3C5]RJE90646.1 hypothetical protein D3P07_00615 [Paenibacillus sp. 1011MAR3C5]
MKKIKFYIHELEYAILFLYELKLIDYHSRMKTRFIKLLTERFQQYKDEYFELVKEHAHLDEDGEPLLIEDSTQPRYDIKDMDKFKLALIPLLEEEFIIDVNEHNENMMKSVTKSILHCGLSFGGQDQFLYESLCSKFEELSEDDGSNYTK